MGKLLFGTFLIGIPVILIWSWRVGSKVEFQMMLAAMVLIVFNVVFWTLFEQAGSSLTLFADRNTDLSIFGLFTISAGQTQTFNALFIVLFAPLMSILWTALAKHGLEPSDPGQVLRSRWSAWASASCSSCGARALSGRASRSAIWWLAGLYLIHSIAELCISPVGLQHDHQALHRAHRRHDDGRVVPVDQVRAICRGRGRAVCQRRDGGRAGDQLPR